MTTKALLKLLLIGIMIVLSFSLAACGGEEEPVVEEPVVEEPVVEEPVVEEPVVEEPVVEEPVEEEPAVVGGEINGFWYDAVDNYFIVEIRDNNVLGAYDASEGYIMAAYDLSWDAATNTGTFGIGDLSMDLILSDGILTMVNVDGTSQDLTPIDEATALSTIGQPADLHEFVYTYADYYYGYYGDYYYEDYYGGDTYNPYYGYDMADYLAAYPYYGYLEGYGYGHFNTEEIESYGGFDYFTEMYFQLNSDINPNDSDAGY